MVGSLFGDVCPWQNGENERVYLTVSNKKVEKYNKQNIKSIVKKKKN
jgi:hypothetical protein